jgi:putative transposase
VRRQCTLLGLNRSSYYYEPAQETAENLELMRFIDRLYTDWPFLGSRRMVEWLQAQGHAVNRKRIQRLMRLMGLEAVYPKRRLSRPQPGHRIYPYLLRGVLIDRPDQVWSTDITYLPLNQGFLYLVAILDWYSRYVLTWRLSNTLDGHFCLEALEEALQGRRRPEIFNSDQGCQFTADAFTGRLKKAGVAISMDGRGRALDNVFTERLWRTVKYEHVYLHPTDCVRELECGLTRYLEFYDEQRLHQGLNYQTPASVYAARNARPVAAISVKRGAA